MTKANKNKGNYIHTKNIKFTEDNHNKLKIVASLEKDLTQEDIINKAVMEWMDKNYDVTLKRHGLSSEK
jgi:hypothetical protein